MARLPHPFYMLAACLLITPACASPPVIGITGTSFTVNGAPTHAGVPSAEGLLLNSRMIQGVFDDANATTRPLWRYPDGRDFNATRNSLEFVGNMSDYKSCGLDAFTVGLQGGGPVNATPPAQPWIVSAFSPDGTTLDPAYMARLEAVIAGAGQAGLIPIVSLFYQGQINRINGDAAVTAAVDAVVDWILAAGVEHNVLFEVANEVGCKDFPPSLQPDAVQDIILHAKARSNGTLLVSTSFLPPTQPSDAVIDAIDFVTLHCNGMTPTQVTAYLSSIRSSSSWMAKPKPILFNECSINLADFAAAVADGAGWGYYAQGDNNYLSGFQSPPTNWRLDATAEKRAFFQAVAGVASITTGCAALS